MQAFSVFGRAGESRFNRARPSAPDLDYWGLVVRGIPASTGFEFAAPQPDVVVQTILNDLMERG
ncbi:MAG: hypothetical protein GY947_14835 [Rhodobacteraceae bacterium]|nr:hypothetical protein [Paracoccaceae bacterium]